jgi:hypothetical protein
MLKEQIARSEQYLDRTRADHAKAALQSTAALDGPVKL